MKVNKRANKILLVVFAISTLVLASYLSYFSITKNNDIDSLNLQIQNLNNEINSKNQQIAKLDEDLKLAKFVCISFSACKDKYNEASRSKFLESAGLTTAEYKSRATGLNYYKYFIEPTGVTEEKGFAADLLPLKLKEFMKTNCPSETYNAPGRLFGRYDYTLGNDKQVSIVVDPETVEIKCAWIYDKTNDSYTKV